MAAGVHIAAAKTNPNTALSVGVGFGSSHVDFANVNPIHMGRTLDRDSNSPVIVIAGNGLQLAADAVHSRSAEAFRREPNPGLWKVQYETSTANPTHAATLQQTLEHINAVPLGKAALEKLKAHIDIGQPLRFVASADYAMFKREGSHLPLTVQVVPSAGLDGKRSFSIFVNADHLQRAFRQDGKTGTTPAKAIRDVYRDLLEAAHVIDRTQKGMPTSYYSYLNNKEINSQKSVDERLRALQGYYADGLKVALAGDQFYGLLTAAGRDNNKFMYDLSFDMADGGVPLPSGGWFSIDMLNGLLMPSEIMGEAFHEAYEKATKSTLSGGAALAFELIDSGVKDKSWRKTPLRIVLNTLDERVSWDSIARLNDALHSEGVPGLKVNNNSLIMNKIATDVGERKMPELVKDMVEIPGYFTGKAGREKLIERAKQALHQLVTVSKKYSPADVVDMARGLKLPQELQTFIDKLGKGLAPDPQNKSSFEGGGKVAKLQVMATT